MCVVIPEELVDHLSREALPPAPLWGRVIDGGDVVRVEADEARPGLSRVATWGLDGTEGDLVRLEANVGGLRAVRGSTELPVEVVRLRTDLFSRQRGILESDALRGRKVLVVGLGSMGSETCRMLAMTGVDRFVVVDKDRLSVPNVSRHAAGLRDVGRLKTRIVAELIHDRNPEAEVDEWAVDFARLGRAETAAAFEGVDLAICAVDEEPARLKFARFALEARVPHLFVGCFERAVGGQVLYWMPGWGTPCYDCILAGAEGPTFVPKGPVDYSSVPDPFQVKAMPGLHVDISFVTLGAVRVALAILSLGKVPPEQLDILNPDYSLYLFGNHPDGLYFERPLQAVFVRTERNNACTHCAPDGRPT